MVPATQLATSAAAEAFGRVEAERRAARHGFWELPHGAPWLATAAGLRLRYESTWSLRHLVILGTGGSSLGAKALATALGMMGPGARADGVAISICDNIDGATFMPKLQAHPAAHTLICAISKSGHTQETIAQLAVAVSWLQAHLGKAWQEHVLVITDPDAGPLRAFAQQHALAALALPSDVGGRFSALSAVGLAPLVLAGLDAGEVLRGAASVMPAITAPPNGDRNVAFALAAWLVAQSKQRNMIAMMMYSDLLPELGAWFAQLWAESLGKAGHGATPVICRGATDQHSLLQLFTQGPDDKAYVMVDVGAGARAALDPTVEVPDVMQAQWGQAAFAGAKMSSLMAAAHYGTVASLAAAGRPLATVSFTQLQGAQLGAFMMICQASCAYAASMLGVNAYDQPGVEDAKARTEAALRAPVAGAHGGGLLFEV